MRQHALRFQCTLPVGFTKYATGRLEDVSLKAAELLKRMVPYATEMDIQRQYRERKVSPKYGGGWVWDLIVVMQFNHPKDPPMPANVKQLQHWYKIQKQLKAGLGN